jgi:DNA-binding MarR family transcriptional regulator
MPSATELDEDLEIIMRASRVISGVVAESVAQVGDVVTMPQLRVLVLVATRHAVNASAVATVLHVHASNASRICDRLVQAGLLDRRDSVTDRRHVVLSLTPAGRRLVSTIMEHRRAAFLRILEQMDPAERHDLCRALDRFAKVAGEPPEDALGGL